MRPEQPEVLEARGTYREDRHGGKVKGDGVRPDCPPEVTGAVLVVWERTIARLEAMRLLDTIDGAYLADYSFAVVEVTEARKDVALAKARLIRVRRDGGKKMLQRVEVAQRDVRQANINLRAAREAMYKSGSQLGIGPIGRARAKVKQQEPADPFEELFRRGKRGA